MKGAYLADVAGDAGIISCLNISFRSSNSNAGKLFL